MKTLKTRGRNLRRRDVNARKFVGGINGTCYSTVCTADAILDIGADALSDGAELNWR